MSNKRISYFINKSGFTLYKDGKTYFIDKHDKEYDQIILAAKEKNFSIISGIMKMRVKSKIDYLINNNLLKINGDSVIYFENGKETKLPSDLEEEIKFYLILD